MESPRTWDADASPEKRAHLLERYLLKEICAALDPREQRKRGEKAVAEIARHALDLLERLAPGTLRVRVSSPGDHRAGRSVIEAVLADIPFLVDTFRLTLARLGLRETIFMHPLLAIEREEDGTPVRLGRDEDGARSRESFLYAEVPQIEAPAQRAHVESSLSQALSQVRDAVADHGRMVRALREHTAEIEFAASRLPGGAERAEKLMGFLNWLADDNYVFLGYRRYDLGQESDTWWMQAEPMSGLGILREVQTSRFAERTRGSAIPEIIHSRIRDDRFVFFDKSRTESTVHRAGRLDCISVKILNEEGRLSGFGKFMGLLTSKAIRTRASDIPMLRERRVQALAATGATPGSHTYKTAVEAFDSLPIEFLFPFDLQDVIRAVHRIVAAIEGRRVETFVVADGRNRSFFVSVILPRPLYDENLRVDLQRLLETRYHANYIDHRSSFVDDEAALIHFFCSTSDPVDLDTLSLLERDVQARTARWKDRFEAALLEAYPAERVYRLSDDYVRAFPEEYRLGTPPGDAVRDVLYLERLRGGDAGVEIALYRDPEEGVSRLKVFQDERPYLTDHLPVLDHFGLRVIDATLTELSGLGPESLWIVTFRIEEPHATSAEAESLDDRILDGLRLVLRRAVKSDPLNRLVLQAGLTWREVDLLRAYQGYAQQIGAASPLPFVAAALRRHPAATRAPLALFHARFDPDLEGDRKARENAARDGLTQAREPIATVDEDRVFALYSNLIRSTLRTSFFAESAAPEIALKILAETVDGMPAPAPWVEIFVNAADMSGVHLRGGPVARGGIRWSDRVQDFRAEILGLMRTQRLKNGLIVPTGSKGGFVLKRRPSEPARARAEADRQYARFIRALLRLTDNIVAGEIVPPARVVRHDGDDPYLVVAADKGTAHLSDTANAIALELGFWLGDAFASGGSHGYDHKRQGITARGAWECVKRHFLELGLDPERESFTIAGIGDMSGDVFGNGLLLARNGKLLAAFNHQHIFLDPDADPVRSWEERARLFALPSSTWRDYDAAKLSEGGGVHERSARSIPLAPRVRQMLGVGDESLSGEQLIRAILRMPVDLLWNGGIGTYVKASGESHASVGDRANQSVRADACELRARVVGEGGNLGFTPLARIEYALHGGRVNTDAIDNSGGVDLSDHEVNFKILLAGPCAEKRLSFDQRNEVLAGCVDAACRSVLAHNADQSRCLSMDRLRAQDDPDRMLLAADFLRNHAALDPALEFLPDRDALCERERLGEGARGFTRPELAILLGYTKMMSKRELVASPLLDHPSFRAVLHAYFPEDLRQRFPEDVEAHRVRREIAATCLANRVIDQAGVTLIPELVGTFGVGVADVVAAYYTVDRLLEADHVRWAIGAQPVAETARLRALVRLEDAVRAGTCSRIGLERRALLEPEEIAHWTGLLRSLREAVQARLDPRDRAALEGAVEALVAQGFSGILALEIELLPYIVRSLGVVSMATRRDASLARALGVHDGVGDATRVTWMLDRLREVHRGDGWDRLAVDALSLELLELQRDLAERLLEHEDDGDPVARFRAERRAALDEIASTAAQVERDGRFALAPYTVLAQQVRRLR